MGCWVRGPRWLGLLSLLSLIDGAHEAQHSSFLPIAHKLPLPIYITDTAGWIVYHNAAAAALWGHAPEPGTVRWCGSEGLFTRDGTLLPKVEQSVASASSAIVRG